jgi:hypothetical protein
MTIPRTAPAALVCAAGLLLAAGCGAPEEAPTEEEATPHGYVEGAEETAEPQWRLVLADAATGAVHLFDPATEEAAGAGEVPGVTGATTDGRFAYLTTDDGAAVLDSGTWTVDHGDHVHYYRAPSGTVGEVSAPTGTAATGDVAVTVLTTPDGVQVLDRAALEEGEVTEAAAPEAAAAVPFAGHLVTAAGDGTVAVLDREGAPADHDLAADCPDPRGQAVTRRGAVLGCADGALLLTEADDGALHAEKVPHPDGVDPVAGFHHRAGTPVLAGLTEDGGVAVLDVGAAEWTPIDTGPAVAASAAGEGLPVLVLGDDGTLRAFDPATGEETASTDLVEPAEDGPAPSVWIDTGRAYVNDPAADVVHEIDYNDDLRVARTFDLEFSPDHMVETGW